MSDDRATPEHGDQGFSLIDVIVATSIMAVIMVIVTGAIIEVYSDVNRTDGLSAARDQIGNSFSRLDKDFRYATWVSTPGQVGNAWYLEYMVAYIPSSASPSPSPSSTSAAVTSTKCEQLAFRNGVLTRAEWSPGTTPGTPTTIATDLAQTGATAPFTVYTPGTRPYSLAPSPNVNGVGRTYEHEHSQIRLRFSGHVGKVDLPLDVQFTAANTDRNTPAANDCSNGRPTS
jgi:hypothetical protein